MARSSLIPQRALVAGTAFRARLDADSVVAALARGLRAGGLPWPDVCALAPAPGEALTELLSAVHFDARMRDARALVIAERTLAEPSLAHSVAFELATRARQSGVPAYAVTASKRLDAFDARMLDLQSVAHARTAAALTAAGRRLAVLIAVGLPR
jgi:glycerate 2-kinase